MSDVDEIDYSHHAGRLGSGTNCAWDLCYGASEHGQLGLVARTKRIVHSWTDSSDEPHFAWILETDTGFAFVDGWHDYTGWDCQSGLDVHEYDTLQQAIDNAGDDLRRIWSEVPSSPLGESGSGEVAGE